MSGPAEVFRANLSYLLEQTGQTALSTSAGAGIPNQTFNEWLRQGRTTVKGKGREHLEALRVYFNHHFINQFFIRSIGDFWRSDLLDGFATGVHAQPLDSPPPSVPEDECCLAALSEAVKRIVAARRWLDGKGRCLSLAEIEEGQHMVEVALEHLHHLGPALERHSSASPSMEDDSFSRCDKCGISDVIGLHFTGCEDCDSFLCERCMIDGLCLDCHRQREEEVRQDALNRSEDLAGFVEALTENEAASLRDRLRQRTRQAEYRPGEGKRRPNGTGR